MIFDLAKALWRFVYFSWFITAFLLATMMFLEHYYGYEQSVIYLSILKPWTDYIFLGCGAAYSLTLFYFDRKNRLTKNREVVIPTSSEH